MVVTISLGAETEFGSGVCTTDGTKIYSSDRIGRFKRHECPACGGKGELGGV
jgi:predicted methyltransferase